MTAPATFILTLRRMHLPDCDKGCGGGAMTTSTIDGGRRQDRVLLY